MAKGIAIKCVRGKMHSQENGKLAKRGIPNNPPPFLGNKKGQTN